MKQSKYTWAHRKPFCVSFNDKNIQEIVPGLLEALDFNITNIM